MRLFSTWLSAKCQLFYIYIYIYAVCLGTCQNLCCKQHQQHKGLGRVGLLLRNWPRRCWGTYQGVAEDLTKVLLGKQARKFLLKLTSGVQILMTPFACSSGHEPLDLIKHWEKCSSEFGGHLVFMIRFTSFFAMDKAHVGKVQRWGIFPKWRDGWVWPYILVRFWAGLYPTLERVVQHKD